MKISRLTSLLPFKVTVPIAICIAMFASVSIHAQDCSTTTDEQLVTSILHDIKADSLLGPQMSHIVVGSVNRFIKLQGWTDTKRSFERLYAIVSGTPCVKAVNVNNFDETPPPPNDPRRPQPGSGCGPGLKACGDVCIPENDSCSERTKSAN
jgi:hypothetical protein